MATAPARDSILEESCQTRRCPSSDDGAPSAAPLLILSRPYYLHRIGQRGAGDAFEVDYHAELAVLVAPAHTGLYVREVGVPAPSRGAYERMRRSLVASNQSTFRARTISPDRWR